MMKKSLAAAALFTAVAANAAEPANTNPVMSYHGGSVQLQPDNKTLIFNLGAMLVQVACAEAASFGNFMLQQDIKNLNMTAAHFTPDSVLQNPGLVSILETSEERRDFYLAAEKLCPSTLYPGAQNVTGLEKTKADFAQALKQTRDKLELQR